MKRFYVTSSPGVRIQTMKRKPRVIAPRLFSGERRESIGHGLPPEIKSGLRLIARNENKSVSWVLEQIIIKYFGFKRPKYIERKKK